MRRNALKCDSSEKLARALAAEDVAARVSAGKETRRGAPDALAFDGGRPRAGIFGLETYRLGWFEVQDAGSQCIVSAVTQGVEETIAAKNVKKGLEGLESETPLKVLDACCGNGGKTLALASRLHALGVLKYRIDCFDVDARRLRHLAAATRRAGCEDATRVVTKLDLRAIASSHVETNKYDAVLVDAPCSSAGAPSVPVAALGDGRAEDFFEEPATREDSASRTRRAPLASLSLAPARRDDKKTVLRRPGTTFDGDEIDGDVFLRPTERTERIRRPCVRSRRRSVHPRTPRRRLRRRARVRHVLRARAENEDVAAWFGDAFAATFEPMPFPTGVAGFDRTTSVPDAPSETPTHVVGRPTDRHGRVLRRAVAEENVKKALRLKSLAAPLRTRCGAEIDSRLRVAWYTIQEWYYRVLFFAAPQCWSPQTPKASGSGRRARRPSARRPDVLSRAGRARRPCRTSRGRRPQVPHRVVLRDAVLGHRDVQQRVQHRLIVDLDPRRAVHHDANRVRVRLFCFPHDQVHLEQLEARQRRGFIFSCAARSMAVIFSRMIGSYAGASGQSSNAHTRSFVTCPSGSETPFRKGRPRRRGSPADMYPQRARRGDARNVHAPPEFCPRASTRGDPRGCTVRLPARQPPIAGRAYDAGRRRSWSSLLHEHTSCQKSFDPR